MNLKNAIALITGGSSGIGRAVAQSLAASGARVAITGRDQRRLAETARQLGVHPIQADVAAEADVERTYREVLDNFGDLDILVNNAGSGAFKNLVDFDRKEFEAVFATNVTGAMLMAREAAKHFVKRQRGNIVNIASTAALRGAPKGTAYYGSKFALRGMTECWRAELRQHNVRVFLVEPKRSLDKFLSDGRVAPKRECDQAPRGRHRLRGESDAGNGGPRLRARAIYFRDKSKGLMVELPGNANLPIGGRATPIGRLAFPGCMRMQPRYLMLFSLPSFT